MILSKMCDIAGLRPGLPSVIAALGFTLLSGCGGGDDAPERYNITGTVVFNGEPLPAGEIQLIPNSAQGVEGPAGNAVIVDGKFNTAERGTGIVGGAHYVVINGFDGQGDPGGLMPMGKPLFAGYRFEHEFPPVSEAPEEGPLKVEFEVPASAAKR